MPKVTILMAAYNAAEYIHQSIQSILNQTMTDFELIIINDGSTDNTVDIVKTFDDDRIILVNNNRNQGLVYTRNIILDIAKGEYIAINDSDDISISTRLETQVNKLDQNPNLAVVGSRALIIDKNGAFTGQKLDVINGKEKIKTILFFENTFVHSSIMIRTSVLREVGGYGNYPGTEDYDLFVRISHLYDLDNIEEYLVYYRMHDQNFSLVKMHVSLAQLKKIEINQLQKLGITFTEDLLSGQLGSYEQFIMFYKKVIYANRNLKIYDEKLFEEIIFKKWVDFILSKEPKRAFLLLLKRPFFKYRHINKKIIKKALKVQFA